MDVNFYFNVKQYFPSFFSLAVAACHSLSLGDGCGNNAYWVKTNLYTNLRKFPTIPPVRPPCTSAGNASRCPHTGNMYDTRILHAMHPPTHNSDKVIGWKEHCSHSDSTAMFYSRRCCCYSASRAPSRRHSASVFVFFFFLHYFSTSTVCTHTNCP